jgi:hypothetical protein
MQLLEGTEPEIESRKEKERLGLGSWTIRIADILTTAGSEVDGQPYSKVGLPGLKVIWAFRNKIRRNQWSRVRRGVNMRTKNREESRERRVATGEVYRGSMDKK